jgi:polysaccharide export outer membrane protein
MNIKRISQNIIIASLGCILLSVSAMAQSNPPVLKDNTKKADKADKVVVETAKPAVSATPEVSPTPEAVPTPSINSVVVGGEKPVATEDDSEEAYVNNMYSNSILKDYKLGPEDVISVEVFGQCPNYCKTGATVPPTGRISYPLIKEGVFVAGRTVESVAAEITKKLDEYIIDPKVQVTLDKAMSARYSVMGDVRAPGVKPMARRISIMDAIGEAGGIAETGSKKNVLLLRMGPDGKLVSQSINLGMIEKGKNEMIFLNPGDQVVVQGNMFKTLSKVTNLLSFASFARVFTGGF